MSDISELYQQWSPLIHYPFETIIISMTLFFTALWLLGGRINKEIAEQLAIPLIKQITAMGFKQHPAFNTVSHSIRRGYIELPSPIVKYPTNDDMSDLTPENLSQYMWLESSSSFHLYATNHSAFNGIHCHIKTIPRHDMFLQFASMFGIINKMDEVTVQIAFPQLAPFFWSLSRDGTIARELKRNTQTGPSVKKNEENVQIDESCSSDEGNDSEEKNENKSELKIKETTLMKPQQDSQQQTTRFGNVVDLGGLKLTHSLAIPDDDYIFTTDTPELIHNLNISPFTHSLVDFFTTLRKNTTHAFDFCSLSVSDQNDGYDVVNLHQVPQISIGSENDIPIEEECALLSLTFAFDFEKVPRTGSKEDPNNQVFVTEWMTKICAQLFHLAHTMAGYQLPKHIAIRNIKTRENFEPDSQLKEKKVSTHEQRKLKRKEDIEREGLSNSIIGVRNRNNNVK
jgi:hypothetical protein